MDRQSERVGPELDGLHAGTNRAAGGGFGHSQLFEQCGLPGGGAAAVASHRGDDERLEAEAADGCGGGADDRPIWEMPAAAGGDRNAAARSQASRQAAAADGGGWWRPRRRQRPAAGTGGARGRSREGSSVGFVQVNDRVRCLGIRSVQFASRGYPKPNARKRQSPSRPSEKVARGRVGLVGCLARGRTARLGELRLLQATQMAAAEPPADGHARDHAGPGQDGGRLGRGHLVDRAARRRIGLGIERLRLRILNAHKLLRERLGRDDHDACRSKHRPPAGPCWWSDSGTGNVSEPVVELGSHAIDDGIWIDVAGRGVGNVDAADLSVGHHVGVGVRARVQ